MFVIRKSSFLGGFNHLILLWWLKKIYQKSFLSYIFFLPSAPTPRASCQTIAGIDCVFPFKYNDITYNGCITIKDPENKPWCSTKVNKQNKH